MPHEITHQSRPLVSERPLNSVEMLMEKPAEGPVSLRDAVVRQASLVKLMVAADRILYAPADSHDDSWPDMEDGEFEDPLTAELRGKAPDELLHISVQAEGQLQTVGELADQFPEEYSDSDSATKIATEYIQALDSVFVDTHDLDLVRKLDTLSSPMFGQGALLTMIERGARDTPRESWHMIDTMLKSPVALHLGDAELITSSVWGFAGALNHESSSIQDIVLGGSIVDTMKSIVTMGEVAKFIDGSPHWGYRGVADSILETISRAETGGHNPFVRLLAKSTIEGVRAAYTAGQPDRTDSWAGDSAYTWGSVSTEGTFGNEYQNINTYDFPDSELLYGIRSVANDGTSVAEGPGGRIFGVYEPNGAGELISLSDYAQKCKIPGIDNPERFEAFCQTLFLPQVRQAIQQDLGIDFHDTSLSAQLTFAAYVSRQEDSSQYDQLKQALSHVNGKEPLIEAFLATEFGDDFGETILSIAEHASPEQATRVFELINKYRYETREFANMYKSYDPELAHATEMAMNERLADILAVIESVARDGETTVDTAPHREQPSYKHDGKFDTTITSVDEAIETMELLQETFERRRLIVNDPDTVVSRVVANEDEVGYQIYRFHHDKLGDALLHVRSEGSGRYDKAFEYGSYDGVEATISWVVNPTGDHMLASDKDPKGVSIRFDREGRIPGEAPDSDNRSPVRDDGMISVDISSGMGDKQTAAVRIGRMVSAGNILRAAKQRTHVSLHHNTNYFDQAKYGTAKAFKGLANYVQTMAETKINSRRSKKVGRRAAAATVASPRR